jgi:hypothetical protein
MSGDPIELARDFRRTALSLVDPLRQPIPPAPSVAFAWPTELCSIGCAHCSFGSRPKGRGDKRLLARHPETLAHWLADAGTRKLVVCGGGEPLDEPDFIVRAVAACARTGLGFEIYTSGVSHDTPRPVMDYIREWKNAGRENPIGIRLSVDAFHEERIGLAPVADWIRAIETAAPHWTVSLRGIRVRGDHSVRRLAALLGAELSRVTRKTAVMVLPSARRLLIEWKGFVFEERGSLKTLARRGLSLDPDDAAVVETLVAQSYGGRHLGRPLSARLTVTPKVLDLEIHADGIVHILESQAPDLRCSLFEVAWDEMRRRYYRDPLLHRIVEGGLPAIAELITDARRAGVAAAATVPYSVERLTDASTLAWVTAAAILRNGRAFTYDDNLRELARRHHLLAPPRQDLLAG